MKLFLPALIVAAIPVQSAMALEVGSVVDLTPNIRGEVIEVSGTNHKVEVYGNPDAKPTGNIEIKSVYFINGDGFTPVRTAYKAFAYMDGITGVTVGNAMEVISANSFLGCTKMTYFWEAEPGTVEVVGDEAFGYTYGLKGISLPAVESIGQFAFRVSGLETASFPNVETIGAGAFHECKSLVAFNGGEKTTTIGNIAFANCPKLQSFTFGPELTSIGSMGFAFAESLRTVVVPESVAAMSNSVFQGSGIEQVFILSDKFMDYCDASKLLRNKSIKNIYCIKPLVYEIKYYLSVGSEDNPAETLATAPVTDMSSVVAIANQGVGDKFTATPAIEGITDLELCNPSDGSAITPFDGIYTITGEDVRVRCRYDQVNILDYLTTVDRNVSAVSSVVADDDAPAEYYTLGGVRVTNPSGGIFIRRTPSGVTVVSM